MINLKNKVLNHINFLEQAYILIMIFLFGLRIGKPTIILILLGAFLIIVSIIRKNITVSTENTLLALVFLSYFAINRFNYSTHLVPISLLISPPLAYFIGLAIQKNAIQKEKTFINLVYVIAISSALFAVLGLIGRFTVSSSYLQMLIDTDQFYSNRWGYNIWTGDSIYPTNFNNQFIFIIAIFPALMIQAKKSTIIKSIIFILFLGAIVSAFVTSTRTTFFLIVFSFTTWAFLDQIINHAEGRKRIIKLAKDNWIVLLISALILILAFLSQGFSVVYHSTLSQRLSSVGNEPFLNNRLNLSLEVAKNLLKYPFGNMPQFYAHNLWLDIARVSGFIPMILMLFYSLLTSYRAIQLTKLSVQPYLSVMILMIQLITYLAFMIEPVVEERTVIFLMFCMINGMTFELNKSIFQNRQNI